MKTYVVTIVCTFDDVIVGCFFRKGAAIERANEVVANPDLRHNYKDTQETDSTPVLVRIACYCGKESLGVIRQTDLD